MVTEENAVQHAERIYAAYKDRMVKFLDSVKKVFAEQGWDYTAPFDMSGDDYEWGMLVAPHGESARGDKAFYLAFQQREAAQWGEGPDGITFAVEVTYHGGYVVGGLTPYNYTSEVWVSMEDAEAVEDRFRIIEDSAPVDYYNLCAEYRPPAQT